MPSRAGFVLLPLQSLFTCTVLPSSHNSYLQFAGGGTESQNEASTARGAAGTQEKTSSLIFKAPLEDHLLSQAF